MTTSNPLPDAGATPSPAVAAGRAPVLIIAAGLFLLAGLGSPFDNIEHVTFKDVTGSLLLLVAALLAFWNLGQADTRLRWHPVLALPLLLAVYALASTLWAHPYLAFIEAMRWLLVSLLVWLGLNLFDRDRLDTIAWGVHLGAFAAALWAALQFWLNVSPFTQGPNPASTFGNRNFFAEYMVSALPFSALLLLRAQTTGRIVFLAASTGLVVVTAMMPGTRGALITLLALAVVVLPLGAWLFRGQLPCARWSRSQALVAGGVLLGTVIGLGLVPTGNYTLVREVYGMRMAPLERAAWRLELAGRAAGRVLGDTAPPAAPAATQAAPGGSAHEAAVAGASFDFSAGMRLLMWQDTRTMIGAHPLAGVGAGSWEVINPLFQREGAQVESDYFLHNEFLQLISEYGLAGWAFLIGLGGYLLMALGGALRNRRTDETAPWRATAIASLGALLAVSNFGFPWHLAATAAMLGLALAILAATEGNAVRWLAPRTLAWPAAWSKSMAGALALALAFGLYFSWRSLTAESLTVQAARLAFSVSASGDPRNPALEASRQEAVRLLRAGTDLNPHNRRVAPKVADEFARWGDWANATWAWERTANSRPNVVVLATNVGRGYLRTGQPAKAREFLERARQVQPSATVVRALEVMVLQAEGQSVAAVTAAVQAMDRGQWDFDMLNAAYAAAFATRQFPVAVRAIEARMRQWPNEQAVAAAIMLGDAQAQLGDAARAAQAYQRAFTLAPPAQQAAVLARVPPAFRAQAGGAASASATPPAPKAAPRP